MCADLSPKWRNDADITQGHSALVQSSDNACNDGGLTGIAEGITGAHLGRWHAVSIQKQHSLLWG